MRAAVAVVAFVGAVAVALAQTPVSCTPVPTAPTPTATPTPWPSVNPAGLCPNVCPGWGTLQAGYQFFANNTLISGAAKSINNVDTSDVLVTKPNATASGKWWADNWQPGVYTMQYNVRDTCGRDSSTMPGYKTTATLDYRCNNPPVVVVKPGQQIAVRYGAEVVLDAAESFDLDQVDRSNLKFTWCLMSRPTSFTNNAIYTTQYESVANYIRVPQGSDGSYKQGYALFKPDASGQYTFIVSATDGCNIVQAEMRVFVTLKCCPHTAVANLQSNIEWTNSATTSYTTMLDSYQTSNSSCLPPDYVLSSARTAGAVYKNLYSPVLSDYQNNTVNLDKMPSWMTAKTGCTWPGAVNFDKTATQDDGSCQCSGNYNTWDVLTTPGSYVRRIDPSNTTAIVKTTGQLSFVASLGSTAVSMSSCPQATETTWNNITNPPSRDIRIDTTAQIKQNPLLARPSTSWDATVSFKIANATMTTWANTNTTTRTTTQGNTFCSVSLGLNAPGVSTNNTQVTVAYGAGYDVKQCLGYYSFLLSSTSTDVCPLSTDQVDVEVVCPYPPYISLLCDVNYLLWDGTKFVKNTAAPTTGSTSDTLDGWVQLDARETQYKSTVTYTLTMSVEPPALTYLGANAAGPSAGAPELNPGSATFLTASSTYSNLTAAFLPTRQGQYEVTLWGDDGCNSKSYDSVTVNTQCLPVSASASASPSPTAAAAPQTPIQFAVNASYSTLGAQGNLNNRLNYAIRITNRPQLPYGDVGKYTSTSSVDASSFECMLGKNWNIAGTPNVLGLSAAQNDKVIMGLAGSYNFAVTVLDGCSRVADIPVTGTATCGFPNNVTGAYGGGTTQTIKWTNGGFAKSGVPTLTVSTLPQATAPAGTNFAWFMTAAPGTTTTKVYPSATPVAAAVTCAANQATSWTVGSYAGSGGVSAILRAAGTTDPYGPIQSTTSNTFNTYALSQVAAGTHTIVAQPMGQCDATTISYTINTVCNSPARFVCPGSATCDAGFFQINGASQTGSTWNCAVNRYAPVFINSLSDGGSDVESNQDTLTFTTTLTAPSSATGAKQSWWSAGFFTESVAFTFSIKDTTDDIFQDATGYPNIANAIRTALAAGLGGYSGLGTDNTNRVFLTNADLTTFFASTQHANASLAPALGVWVTGGCYTPGWGRTFTATATYAIVPPKHFRAFGVSNSAGATADARGYARSLAGLTAVDTMPLGAFDAGLRTAVPGIVAAAVTSAYAASRVSASSVSFTTPAPVIVPNLFHFRTSMVTSSGALTALATTSFLPDVDGVFTTSGAVIDDCPGNTGATSWPAAANTQITVVAPTCGTLSGLTLTQYDSSTSNNAASATFSRTFYNSSTGFGPAWTYQGNAPSYNTTAGTTLTLKTACWTGFADNCATKPTGSNGGSFSFPSTSSQQTVVAGFTLPANANQGATIQFNYAGSASPVNGGELHIGCVLTGPVAPATYTNTTSISWFYTIDSSLTVSSVASFLLPANCLGGAASPDLVFAVFPTTASTVPGWSITSLQVITHPASFGSIAAPCIVQQMLAPTASTGFTFQTNFTNPAVAASTIGTPIWASSLGTQTNLPANTFSLNAAYSLSFSFPAWMSTSTCSGSSATTTVNLGCQTYDANQPNIVVTSAAYNLSNWHFNPATVQWTGYKMWNSQVNTDFSFTFMVTGAPANSVLNAANLAYNILPSKLNSYVWTGYNVAANQPIWSPLTKTCYAKTGVTGQFSSVNLTSWGRAFTGESNTTWAAWIDPSTVAVTLAPAYPSNNGDLPWIATPKQNGEYYKEYYNQLGQASFIPDATTDGAASYVITTTMNDKCNPIVTKTATISASCANANAVTVSWAQLGAAAQITDAGSGRVMLKGTVNIPNVPAAVFSVDAHVRKITWTVTPVGAPSWVPPVKIYDADTLYPSFVPVWAGQYSVTLSVDVGNGCGPITSTNTLSVACAVSATPVPVAVVAQGATSSSTTFRRIGQTGTLTIPYLPNTGANQENIYWIGEATCPVTASWWSAPWTVQYTCPSTQYSVRLVNLWPSQILTGVRQQTVQLTVAIGAPGASTPAGIPQGLQDAIYYQSILDPNAISITVGGIACINPYVTDYAAGKIVCILDTTSASVSSAPLRVTATILGVNSKDVNGDLWVPFVNTPMVTGAAGSPSLPTTGGTVILSGVNLAFPIYDPSFKTSETATPGGPSWAPALTTVTIDGRTCSNVMLYGSWTPGVNPQISCTYQPGVGKQLAVTVQLAFQDGQTWNVWQSGVATSYVFSYDAPVANNLVAQGSSTLGGFWATANIRNLGPRYNTVNYQPPMDASMGDTVAPLPGWVGYNDVRLQLGNNIPITMWNITSDDSGSGASVKFWIPAGCGSNLDLRVFRRNTQSVPYSGNMNSFSYAAPVVLCVGQPYVDPTRAGCTRVVIDGNNFGSSMNSTLMNITFWSPTGQYDGQCDDVEYQPGSDYVRVSCRMPTTAKVNDTVRVTNECGQSSGSSVESRNLAAVSSSGSAPTLPASINLAGCGSAYAVGSSQSFSYAINAPMAPATEIRTDTVTKVQLHQGGEWKDQVLSNGLFIGLVLPLILLVVVVYPVYACLSGRKQVGGAWNSSAAAGSSSSAAGAGDKTVTKGATRVTMNPVSFAPAPPVKPAEAPGAVHDNL